MTIPGAEVGLVVVLSQGADGAHITLAGAGTHIDIDRQRLQLARLEHFHDDVGAAEQLAGQVRHEDRESDLEWEVGLARLEREHRGRQPCARSARALSSLVRLSCSKTRARSSRWGAI